MNEWISVEERLPSTQEAFCVLISDGGYVRTGQYVEGVGFRVYNNWSGPGVWECATDATHWRPGIEPPKEA